MTAAFEDINTQVNALKRQIAELREDAVRVAADDCMPVRDIMQWLTRNGMTSGEARQLCVTIIHERRAARRAARQAAEVTS